MQNYGNCMLSILNLEFLLGKMVLTRKKIFCKTLLWDSKITSKTCLNLAISSPRGGITSPDDGEHLGKKLVFQKQIEKTQKF